MDRVWRSIAWGVAVGIWFGVVDGAYAVGSLSSLSERIATVYVAVALYAAVLALVSGITALVLELTTGTARTSTGDPSRRSRSLVALASAGLVTSLVVAWGGGSWRPARVLPTGDTPPRPNIVLISIDTLRPDHLGVYGYERATSPNLDQLARSGVLFETAYSNASWTLPAHASMLTGLDPFAHGVLGSQDRIHPNLQTLAQMLAVAGYQTEAWVGTPSFGYVGADFGFAAGFENFRHYPHPKRYRSSRIARAMDTAILQEAEGGVGNATAQIDSVLGWLAGAARPPFFLFVHLYDVHSKSTRLPYEAPADFRDQFCSGNVDEFEACRDGRCATERLVGMAQGKEAPLRGEDIETLRCLYDGGVAFVDAELGRLFDGLENLGLARDTLVIVTSDHGEAFFEHGVPLHSTLHDETSRIPLLVRTPGGVAGKRAAGIVSLADIVPTVLAVASLPIPSHIQGKSFARVLRGQSGVVSGEVLGVSETSTLYRSGDTKYIQPTLSPESPDELRDELYLLSEDPTEKRNRVEWDTAGLVSIRRALEHRRRESLALGDRLRAGEVVGEVKLPEAARARLRALGYLREDRTNSEK